MYFYLTGVDYKSAPLKDREGIYRKRKEIIDFCENNHHGSMEALFTCNRIEIYGAAKDREGAFSSTRAFAWSFPDFFRHGYFKYGEEDVFKHALRLASGLESQIQGEFQIVTQLDAWLKKESFSQLIKNFWNDVLLLSKEIRFKAGFDKYNDNIASLIYQDIVKYVGSDASFEVIVAGTGKIAELFAEHRIPQAQIKFISHKNRIKAELLAGISGGAVYLPKDLPELILKADVVVGAASSPHYIIRKNYFDKIGLNHGRRLYLYDLALPRNVEPEAGIIKGVLLQNMDDLTGIFERHNRNKKPLMDFASSLIEKIIENRRVVYAG